MKRAIKSSGLKQVLIGIGVIFGLLVTCWGGFTYLDQYARCETVQKLDQKIDKGMEMMKEQQQKSMDILDQKSKSSEREFDFKLLGLELKQLEEQIYQMEKNYTSTPKDPIKRADLERMKRRRDAILIEQQSLKEKK
jgi:pyruvate/2-oxoacid:ferredoxin oxidoreductase beta subunit